MKLKIPDYFSKIKPYVPGKPIEEVEREYGIGNSIKLASNENPLGPSPMAVKAIQNALENLHRYPDASGYELIQAVAEKNNINPEHIVLGNGSDDIIALLASVLLGSDDEAILPQPSFLFYEISILSSGALPVWVPLKSFKTDLKGMLQKINSRTRIIFLNVPHNPTGTIISRQDFEDFIAEVPSNVVVVLDEAYIEFVSAADCVNSFDFLETDKTIVGMRTFSKAFGLAGLRVGYGVMPVTLAELLHRVRQPFNVNALAQAAAAAALRDIEFLQKTVDLVHTEREFIYGALDRLKLPYIRSQANFFMVQVGKGRSADEIFEKLLKQGVIVRSMTSYGYSGYIRVTIGKHEENIRFLEALEKVI
ncbi:MAG: histidinol-phosphate transaminase [Deltaproteobacteria bacterium]|jgi:histidinol-phosphate aminotransferase|nr:histidinol-phosphate transaminase [Deltaproteobacteria bacterium]